jgi:quercetin dioxygenase-like cupin family protein
MSATRTIPSRNSPYEVKSVKPVMAGSDMQARLFILAPGDMIPWHRHTKTGDHYFVLEGALTVLTREPEEARTISVGGDYKIMPGTSHLITNRSSADCRFLLLQGVGTVDWVKADT